MKVQDILNKMSEEEKINLLSGKNNWQTMDYPDYEVTSLFLADGPCGLRKQAGKGDHLGIEDSVPATATVSGGCLAATWNSACAFENGKILGIEAAAEDVDVLLAPAMNIVRSPLCGRNFEYFSEDPYLTGVIAKEYVKGVQSEGVGACLKHFAANNQETEREYIDAIVDERTLREIYLPGFEMAVKEGKPISVMSALNQVNGAYGAESKELLTDILRVEWGFDGFTVSDWYGIVHQDKAVEAGLDLEMPCSNGIGSDRIRTSIEKGQLTWDMVDACCLRMLQAVEKCAKQRGNRTNKTKSEIYAKNHELSRRIAKEGIVLLKNDDNILPLEPTIRVAVIGLYAMEPMITLNGSARVINTQKDIPLDFIKEYGETHISYAQGFTEAEDSSDEELISEALVLAKGSDKVIFFMGQTPGVEMEGHDRKNLSLPKKQEELLEKITSVNENVVVVLSNASAVVMPWQDKVKGIFECFIAGQGFGKAIADLLYGKANPSGKLPVSFTTCLEDISAFLYFPGDKKRVCYNEGVFVGYRYYDLRNIALLYPFGHGLSYTTFLYSDLTIERSVFDSEEEEINVSLTLTNTGKMAGAEVVQLYVGMFDTVVKRPKKELKGFQKVFLQAGEQTLIRFTLKKRDFAYYDVRYKEWCAPEGKYEILIGASSRDIRLSDTLTVVPKNKHLAPISGWSTIGEFRKTPLGEKYYKYIMEMLEKYLPDEMVLFDKRDLSCEEKVNQMPLRFVTLLTNGILDNDMLLAWFDEINGER